jgi:putative membrane protein
MDDAWQEKKRGHIEMKKRITAILLGLLLTAFPCGIVSGEPSIDAPAARAADEVAGAAKDETVYISLGADGAAGEINVVNRIETAKDGVYTDYGDYAEITNLTNDVTPQVEGGAISWQLAADSAGFYYQGKLASGEPPYQFAVKYYLDGAETAPSAMAGRSGRVVIHVEARPNEAAAEYYRENYFCQVQASLDLDRCRNIDAAGAAAILTGRSMSLGYTVLPGKTASFDIAFDVSDFSFGGLTVTAMPFDQKNLTGIDTSGLKDDIREMADGTQELVDGTKELKDGLKDLHDGVSKLSDGAGDAEAGLTTYKKGLKSYTDGVAKLAGNAKQLSDTMQKLAANGKGLKDGYAALSAGLDGLLASFAPMSPPETAGQIAALRAQLAAYGANLNAYVDGITQMASGMKTFSSGVAKLKNPGSELVSGLTEIIGGMSKLADGLNTTAKEMNKLPGEVQKLIDGQTELHDGVVEAQGTFDEWDFGGGAASGPVSFVSERNSPRSVQFIYKTAEITEVKDDAKTGDAGEVEKGFLQKLADLFR